MADKNSVHWSGRRAYLAAWIIGLVVFFVGPWRSEWMDAIPISEQHFEQGSPIKQPAEAFEVGVDVQDITSDLGQIPTAGYVARAFAPNAGVRDPITARALVIQTPSRRIAILTADILLINRWLCAAVMEKLRQSDERWRREDVYFGATHTHSGPAGFPGSLLEEAALGRFDPILLDRLSSRMALAVEVAGQELKSAEIAHRGVRVKERLVRNRTRDGGEVNDWLDVLFFRDASNKKPIATVVVFSAHATCRPPKDRRLSADYPGALCRNVEQAIGGKCLFLAGGVGGMAAPYDMVEREELADWMGKKLCQDVAQEFRNTQNYRPNIEVCSRILGVSLPPPQLRLGGNWRLSPLLGGLLLPSKTMLHGIRFGQTELIGVAADCGGLIARDARQATPGVTTILTSFSGDYIGYVLPDEDYNLDKYEPAHMSFHGPTAASLFRQRLASLSQLLVK